MRHHAPATDRNREPILDVLRAWLPSSGLVLEIGCGTGQHAAYFAPAFPNVEWQPTDVDAAARASADTWCEGIPNVRPALELDASSDTWPIDAADAIFSANVIHISPIETCAGLLRGAGRILPPGGVLALYGPYRRGGEHTAPSNASFDESLRARNPTWGIRNLDDVVAAAARSGLELQTTIEMPANNLSVVFRRTDDEPGP